MRASIEVEIVENAPNELHLFPRESRRGKAQWAIWVKPDGSAILFVGNDQIVLPKNSNTKATYVQLGIDGQIVYTKI